MKMEKTNRNYSIDVARGIAIVLVIVGHAIGDIYNPVNRVILSFHMPLFFLLSGYLFRPEKCKSAHWKDFLIAKIPKFILPQLTLGIIEFAYHYFLGKVGLEFSNISLLYCILRWWFLPVMFETVLLGFILAKLKLLNSFRSSLITLCSIGIVACIIVGNVHVEDGSYYLYLEVMPVALTFYCFGYIMSLLKNRFKTISFHSLLIAFAMTVFSAFVNRPVLMYANQYGNVVLFSMSALFGSYVVFGISKRVHSHLLEWCGKNSVIIYVLQFHVNLVIRGVYVLLIENRDSNLANNDIIKELFCIVLAIPITLIAARIAERYVPGLFGVKKSKRQLGESQA